MGQISRVGEVGSGSVVLAASLVSGLGCGSSISTEPLTDSETVVAPGAFVEVDGSEFTLRGRPYRFVGINYWQAIQLASSGPGGNRERLRSDLDVLERRGLHNLRLMASGEGPAHAPYRVAPPLMPEPGRYDPKLLDALDFLLVELARRDMKAVLCLGNFWQWSGGFAQYVQWSSGLPIPYPSNRVPGSWDRFARYAASFYKNEPALEAYRSHVAAIVERRNGITGCLYRDDPTIMAWELANEPRGMGDVKHFRDWIDETARLIKRLDPHHLVTTGTEGSGPLPEAIGLDFVQDHLSESIDYATAHLWVENWGWYEPDRSESVDRALSEARRYVERHRRLAGWLGKPVVLEEFGMARDGGSFDPFASTSARDRFFDAVLGWGLASGTDPAFAGANVWAWAGAGRPSDPGSDWRVGDEWTGDPPHEPQGWYSVYGTDSRTLQVLERHALSLSEVESR